VTASLAATVAQRSNAERVPDLHGVVQQTPTSTGVRCASPQARLWRHFTAAL
jgi:hypothetical protein